MVSTGHSRLLVVGDGGLDDVLGFIHAKDLLTIPGPLPRPAAAARPGPPDAHRGARRRGRRRPARPAAGPGPPRRGRRRRRAHRRARSASRTCSRSWSATSATSRTGIRPGPGPDRPDRIDSRSSPHCNVDGTFVACAGRMPSPDPARRRCVVLAAVTTVVATPRAGAGTAEIDRAKARAEAGVAGRVRRPRPSSARSRPRSPCSRPARPRPRRRSTALRGSRSRSSSSPATLGRRHAAAHRGRHQRRRQGRGASPATSAGASYDAIDAYAAAKADLEASTAALAGQAIGRRRPASTGSRRRWPTCRPS